MAILPVSHPEVIEFIRCKHVEGCITNFNLSVSIPDAFMKAVESGDLWRLTDPSTGDPFNLIRAAALFDEIAEGGKRNGEPGVVFIDAVNRDNPCPTVFTIEATNPCVTGDTVVNTIQGPIHVRDLINVSFETPDGVAVPNGFFKTRAVDTLVTVTTDMGYTISCTHEHRLMTTFGWKSVNELRIGTDFLVVKTGTYKTPKARLDEFPSRDWSKDISPILVGGIGDGSSVIGFPFDSVIGIIDTSTFKGAVSLIRELWVHSGRPKGHILFLFPTGTRMVNAVHRTLLRLGIVSVIRWNSSADRTLWPTPACLSIFDRMVAARTNEIAFDIVWRQLEIQSATDRVGHVETTPAKGGSEDVYDATCIPSANKPMLWTGPFISHNCAEVPLTSNECCCLGSINLRTHVSRDGHIEWPMLEETVHTGVRFLNDVIMANKFVPSVPQLMLKARETMRIGLGIMGLADLMFRLGVRYGSPESISVASQIMEFVRYHAMLASVRLASERGPFPLFNRSTYAHGLWRAPEPLDAKGLFGVDVPFVDIGRPTNISWEWLRESIVRVGIKNITTTAIAPTGTLSLVAGVSGFGCEPVFALSHRRRILGAGGDIKYEHMLVPELVDAIEECPELKSDPAKKKEIVEGILRTGTCSKVPGVPASISNIFVCAADISVQEHVMMQAALQKFVDGAISKTVNLPPDATTDDIKGALFTAWRSGCKSISVYVVGSRQVEVLTAGTK